MIWVVLLVTLLLTVFHDLAEGIVVGFALGAVLFIHRMSQAALIEAGRPAPMVLDDVADTGNGDRSEYDPGMASDPDVVVYRLKGAFFFGAAATVGAVLDRIADHRRAFVLDFSGAPFLDSTGANTVVGAVRKAQRAGVHVYITGTTGEMRRVLLQYGIQGHKTRFADDIDQAVRQAHEADSGLTAFCFAPFFHALQPEERAKRASKAALCPRTCPSRARTAPLPGEDG